MDGRGGKVNSVESVLSVTGVPTTAVFLQHGSKSQVAYMNLRSLSDNN